MNDSSYKVAFSVLDSGYRDWWIVAIGLSPCLFFAILIFLVSTFKLPVVKRASSSGFIVLFIGFSALWSVAVFLTTFGDYQNARDELLSGKADYVEGIVENFVPLPYRGHGTESFTVKGIPFAYSDFIVTAGFNHASSRGGPIRQGLYVRIWYTGNEILKLEIRKDV